MVSGKRSAIREAVMSETYDDHGIRFQYPDGWEIEVTEDGSVTTVSFHAPEGLAFGLVTIDEDRPEPSDVADQALDAMREDYSTLDAVAAEETIGGHRAVGHDAEFISLDIANTCAIRCFDTNRRTVLLFTQAADLADVEAGAILASLRNSFEETDD
jgi:hypothetical protein